MAHKDLEFLRQTLREAAQSISIGDTYTHYKDPESIYTVLGFTILEATDEAAVRYTPDYAPDVEFTRPISSFMASVEVDGKEKPRFEPVT